MADSPVIARRRMAGELPCGPYWIVSFADVNPVGCLISGGFFNDLRAAARPVPGIEQTPSDS
jgi:hypothetical protein